jgi:hypothetical protein
MAHTTTYLKGTPEQLIADISQMFEGYNGEVEFSKVEDLQQYSGHWIGQIAIYDEEGELIGMTEEHHVNLYLPEEVDTSIFLTKKPTPPQNPFHTF